jgi:hypothetical protein
MLSFSVPIRLFQSSSDSRKGNRCPGDLIAPRRSIGLVIALILCCSPGPLLFAGGPDTLRRFGEFRDAAALAADPGGILYVLDRGANQLLKYSPAGILLLSTGGYGWEGASFDRPADFSLTEGLDFYVADYGNHRIVRLDRQGTFVEAFDLRGDDQLVQRGYPTGIAQSRFGDLFVIDGDNRQLIMIGSARSVQKSFGGIGSGKGTLRKPSKIRIGLNDRLYIQDDSTLVMFDLFGNYLGQFPGVAGRSVAAFTLDNHALYTLIGSSVIAFDDAGESRRLIDLAVGAEPIDPREVVDFLVEGDRIYFLLKRSVVVRPVDNQ